MTAFNLTPLRRRVLGMFLAGHGLSGRTVAYEIAEIEAGHTPRFKTHQSASRWGAGYMAPLVAHGLVLRYGNERGGLYRITEKGRAAIAPGKLLP